MRPLTKNTIIILGSLLLVFGFFLTSRVLAACDPSVPTSCGTDYDCCQFPGTSSFDCYKKLETNWPPSPGGSKLNRCSTLPDLVKYFYEWGLAIAGVLTFFSLIVGGVFYLSSAGNPGAMNEAKDRIYSAILGLLLVLGSWMILNLINPELTNFKTSSLDWKDVDFYECDTDEDYCKLNPGSCKSDSGDCLAGYKCNDPNKGDGKKEGVCERKQEEATTTEVVALAYEGPNWTAPESPHVLQIDQSLALTGTHFVKSVLAFYYDTENKSASCSLSCSACGAADCTKRYNTDYACWWDGSKCFTKTQPGAMGTILQLYEKGKPGVPGVSEDECDGMPTDIPAYEKKIDRYVSPVQCVKLINPGQE